MLLRLEALEEQMAQRGAVPAAQAPAPDFELPDLSGEPVKLSHWRGRRVLLVFFNPQCGFCEQMAPGLAALNADGSDGPPPPAPHHRRSANESPLHGAARHPLSGPGAEEG